MADTLTVLARMQAALSVYDPTWDVSAGTATYKILEAVAAEIANANNNSVLQTYSYDINTKSGQELDVFCNLFGVYRQQGKRASGTVTFTASSSQIANITIPLGTQVAIPVNSSTATPAIYFSTTAPAVLLAGETSVDVPVLSTLAGSAYNVPANSISSLVTSLISVSSVNNSQPMSGGSDPESDAELRNRWQSTAFNNTTGTPGKYIISALQNNNVRRANTVSPHTFYTEQIQIQATLSGGSSGVKLDLVAYSGMVNPLTGNTFSGTTVVASGYYAASTTGAAFSTSFNALVSGVAPGSDIVFTASPSGNTITQGFTITSNTPSPYRVVIDGSSPSASGYYTVSGCNYVEWVKSSNQDIGVSGTLSSYIPVGKSGVLYPQGNEFIGSNLNAYNQVVFSNNTDYYYPGSPVPQLTVNILNGTNNQSLFIGNNIEVISEYIPQSSRATSVSGNGNYIDIFIDGTTAALAQEQVVFNPTLLVTSGNANSTINTAYYILASGSAAYANSSVTSGVYVPINQQPLINFPSQIGLSSSGIADTITLYNQASGTSTVYPIALNPWGYINFTAVLQSGANNYSNNFLPVTSANTFLYPGLALASGVATASGGPFYITQVTTSGVYLNAPITGNYTTVTSISMSGRALAFPIYDNTTDAGSVNDSSGLVFYNGTPPNGWPTLPTSTTWATYNHSYNSDVVDVESLIQQSRPIGVNTLVHQATFFNFNVNVTVVLSAGSSLSTVQNSIYNTLSTMFAGIPFNGFMSFAGISSNIISINGVSNARLNSIDFVSLDGTILQTFTSDFIIPSNGLPYLNEVNITVRGASNF